MTDIQTAAVIAAGIGWLLAQIPKYNRHIRHYLRGGADR